MNRFPRPLSASFYQRKADIVARQLIGKTLLRRTHDPVVGETVVGGTIVETEAYLSTGDPSCHASRGQTRRNRTMFGPGGTLYVYTIHAKHCLNAVTELEGRASAVLIRSIEPRWGIEFMQRRRGYDDPLRLCRGPAMLCQSLDIDLTHDGITITEDDLVWIGRGAQRVSAGQIGSSPRIGISQAIELPLRFYLRDNRFVSGPKKLNV